MQMSKPPIPKYVGPLGFFRRLRRSPPERILLTFLFLLKILFSFPAYFGEWLFRSQKIEAASIQNPPIFILGHYRSGTTLLHKLLAHHPNWGYLDGLDNLLPHFSPSWQKMLAPLLRGIIEALDIKHPHFHNYRFRLDDPIEEEVYLIYAGSPYSAYWGFVFPRRWKDYLHRYIFFRNQEERENWKAAYLYLLKKSTLKHGGKRLVLKNPPNTGRIRALLELFPEAKFVFLHRNPYFLFYSTEYLFREVAGKYYSLQHITPAERETLIFRHYRALMELYEKEKALIPAGNLYELGYEKLLAHPEEEIRKIFVHLKLDAFDKLQTELRKRLASEKKYSTKKYCFNRQQLDKIYREWGCYIDQWNYARPDPN